jgi:hypothetical protein
MSIKFPILRFKREEQSVPTAADGSDREKDSNGGDGTTGRSGGYNIGDICIVRG